MVARLAGQVVELRVGSWGLYAGGLLALLAALLALRTLLRYEPVHRWLYGVRPGVRLEGRDIGGMYPAEVEALLREWNETLRVEPRNARLDPATGQVVPGRDGVYIDIPGTLRRVMEAGFGEDVELVRVQVPHRWTAASLAGPWELAGRYSTVLQGNEARRHNIRKAMGHINNAVVFPGDVFSFMGLMPPFTREAGWQEAGVMEEGQMIAGLGGGICQVSSTLYNAILAAGFQVVERHRHSGPVYYVPPGCDAAVAEEPFKDLRFRNNTDRPVVVRATVEGLSVTVALYRILPAR